MKIKILKLISEELMRPFCTLSNKSQMESYVTSTVVSTIRYLHNTQFHNDLIGSTKGKSDPGKRH